MKKNNLKNQILIALFVFAIFFLPAINSKAQTQADINSIIESYTNISQNIEIRQTPEYPGPNQTVSLEAISYAIDLSRSHIRWKLSDETIFEGIGLTKINVNSGKAGESEDIDITISSLDGREISRKVSIRPSEIEILWHSDSYVPPFYKGKPLFAKEGNVTFTALPNIIDKDGKRINENNLIYKWELNGRNLPDYSGFGKNSFNVNWTARRGSTLAVTAENLDGSIKARKIILVNPFEPKLEMYEVNPLYGEMLNKALPEEFILDKEDVIIKSYPYFFDINDINKSSTEYIWTVDGTRTGEKASVIFLTTQGLTGTSRIELSILNREKLIAVEKIKNIIIK